MLNDMDTSLRNCTVVSLLAIVALAAAAKDLKKQFLNVDGKKPPGYAHMVTSAPGKMIFISGRGGAGKDGKLPPDFTAQATNTSKT